MHTYLQIKYEKTQSEANFTIQSFWGKKQENRIHVAFTAHPHPFTYKT